MTRAQPIVAIDGPAGAGKSTVARMLAQRLGFVLLDTGALYRTIALAARRADVSWEDHEAVTRLACDIAENDLLALEPDADPQGRGLRVLLRGEDVSQAIRAPEISMGASAVSAIGGVRAALLDMQRAVGRDGGVVAEGRDIGTVVFPDAEVKLFLTASVEVRGRRRFDELVAKGVEAKLEDVLDEVRQRDKQDSEREVAPLRQADDAVLVDSSGIDVEQVLDRMEAVVDERRAGA
jgi:cytidylate kinase